MDAVEVARRQAASLHQHALDRGTDPWKPLALVLAEVEREGFAAEAIAPGATQLGNAQAKFDPTLGLILYAETGTDFDRAFLIAHELGHALLGDADGSCDPDPERSSEPVPEGEERVVAHGPRQRREVQMDLFARELLLPRLFVKRLHLEEGMTGKAIADRLGAPPGAVYQQLFDALLLPETSDKARRADPKPLNPGQTEAARHEGEPFLLEAGPGTGKTQTLTARVTHLLARGVDPRRILVLTFSNRAAGELTERIAGPGNDALAAMWIGTFHGFGLDVLHTFGDRIGRGRKPTLLDRAGAIALLEDELPRLSFRHHRDLYDPTTVVAEMLSAISRAQDEMCDHAHYAHLAGQMKAAAEQLNGEAYVKAMETADRAAEVAVLYARYDQLKKAQGLVDFGDLVMLAVNLLEDDDVAASHYRGRYHHVLVDEYQDVNRASVRMLKALKPDGKGLWAVGDARQSIYRFRGASSRNMALFKRDFDGAKDGGLSINYRSSEEIVNLFGYFGTGMTRVLGDGDPAARPYATLQADRGPSGVTPELIVTTDKSTTAPMIADIIEADRLNGGAYRDHAVLVSGNDRLAVIGRELEALGIPVLFLGSLFERPEIKDLLCLLSIATDPWAAGLVRVACMPEFNMDLASVVAVQEALRALPRDGSRPLLDPELAGTLSPPCVDALRALAHALHGIGFESDPWFALAGILLDRTRITARHAQRTSAADRSRAIAVWQFMNFVKAARDREKPAIPALLARVRRLLRAGDERELRHLPAAAMGIDAVRLMTIHGAKGLEFPAVHLPGLNADTIPKAPHLGRPACPPPEGMIEFARGSVERELAVSHDEEQDCLLYVALSRARHRLHLYRCSVQKNGKTARPESAFLPRLGAGLATRMAVPSRALPPSADASLVPVQFDGPMRVAAWRLATYRRCARRFLYMHVLRTGGTTEPTPYKRVHDIVRAICRDASALLVFPDAAELERITRAACAIPELIAHGYYEDFVQLALDLVAYYGAERRTMRPAPATVIELVHEQDIIVVDAHDVVQEGGGTSVWLLQTGHARKNSDDMFDVRAAVIAAMTRLPNAKAHMLNLADRTRRTIEPKKGAEGHFTRMAGEILSSARSGVFPKMENAGPRGCGNCPALMVCDALPAGAVTSRL